MATEQSSTSGDGYYTYALFRGDGRVFYIGKGKRDRWSCHERDARNGRRGHKFSIIRDMQARGVEVIKVKLHEGLTEAVAHEYEIALIKAIGRGRDGPLANLTDGGDGSSGFKHSPEGRIKLSTGHRGIKPSQEALAKRSASMCGRKASPETLAKLRGKIRSSEHCANISAAKRGFKHSPESRANMSAAGRGKPKSPKHRANISAARRGNNRSSSQPDLFR